MPREVQKMAFAVLIFSEGFGLDHLSFFCSTGVQAYVQQYEEISTIHTS